MPDATCEITRCESAAGFDPIPWLAQHVLGAAELCMIHAGRLSDARSSICGSARGYSGSEGRFFVEAGQVRWSRDDREGVVAVRSLVTYAARRRDPEVGDRLVRRYREYVVAATAPYTLDRRSPRYQADPRGNEEAAQASTDAARELAKAAESWWTATPPGHQLNLF